MINFDFDYYKPSDIRAAYDLYKKLEKEHKKVFYYAGGTELVTSFRKGTIKADAVIDIKGLSGIKDISVSSLGACASLNEVIELDIPILSEVFDKIGDHTVRNAITLGGNICGRLPYKEVVLSLMALDAKLVIFTEKGFVEKSISEIFDKRLKLEAGDILYQVKLESSDVKYAVKRITESTGIDYPLVHIMLSKHESDYLVGLSGYGSCPLFGRFESLNEKLIVEHFTELSKDCIRGSKVYKNALLEDALNTVIKEVTYD